MYMCHVCYQSFGRKFNLQRHARSVHDNITPSKLNETSKKFYGGGTIFKTPEQVKDDNYGLRQSNTKNPQQTVTLVDIDSYKAQQQEQQQILKNEENNNKALTDAIRSLATSNEFRREYYGDSAVSLARLDKEMREILDRTGIGSDEKLQLYNQKLQRYLTLLRLSEKSQQTQEAPALQPPPLPEPVQNPFEFRGPPTPMRRVSSDSELVEKPSPARNSQTRKVIQSKFRSNLPRTTPKQDILRNTAERRKVALYDDYFKNWETLTPKTSKPKRNVK